MADRPVERGYHHGNLRQALLDAAREMAEEGGVETITIRGAARRVGVSHPAAFRHFADKRALLTAFATRAASRLANELELANTKEDPRAFFGVGQAYLRFALNHPAEFRIVFREELLDRNDKDYVAQMQRLAGTLAGAGDHVALDGPLPKRAILAWSATHGLAALYLDGALTKEIPQGRALEEMSQVLALLEKSGLFKD